MASDNEKEFHDVTIKLHTGGEKTFVIRKCPATDQREIFTRYVTSLIPKAGGGYSANAEVMQKLMAFIGVRSPANPDHITWLINADLINSHVSSCWDLAKLEAEFLEHYCTGFTAENITSIWQLVIEKAAGVAQGILERALTTDPESNE